MRNLQVFVVAAVLMAIATAITSHKVRSLGLPLQPKQDAPVWTVEARATFRASGGAAKARLAIPATPVGLEVLEEDFISANFGVAPETQGVNRAAIWTIRRARGVQVLYYRTTVYPTGQDQVHLDPFPGFPRVPEYPELMASAVEALLTQVRSESADIETFARQLITRINGKGNSGVASVLLERGATRAVLARRLVEILAGARIPARLVWGIELVDGVSDAPLVPWIEVHNEQRWIAFDPVNGKSGFPARFMVWSIGAQPLFEVDGGSQPEVQFSIARGDRSVVAIAHRRAELDGSRAMDFSLFGLPLQVQNVYKILLTVPLGALLVAFLRNVVGIKTFGTFMPVLIALAFRETQLAWGVVLFSVVVSLGLLIRFYLERLHLLLVPRLTAVLIIVVMLILAISVISHQLGLDQGLSVALFPMVILAMTIERMSIVWEEHGAMDATIQGLGSLVVAAGAFLVMSNEQVTYLGFVFPELLLVVLALALLLGRYTGYRLSEFWRFRSLLLGRSG